MFQAKVNGEAFHWQTGAFFFKKKTNIKAKAKSSICKAKLKGKSQHKGKANVKGKADGQDQAQPQELVSLSGVGSKR